MDILSLSLLAVSISILDEIVNGRLKTSKKLLNWFDKQFSDSEQFKIEK